MKWLIKLCEYLGHRFTAVDEKLVCQRCKFVYEPKEKS